MGKINAVYIVPPKGGVDTLFEKFGYETVDRIEDADALVFTGGSDINPALYGEKPLPSVSFFESRDRYELAAYSKAKELNMPMFGICRGGQFLNVMAGGKLWQNVDGHRHGNHDLLLLDKNGTQIGLGKTTSCHHQMMRPTKEAIILAVSPPISTFKEAEKEKVYSGHNGMDSDIEALVYPDQSLYCFQGHPEWDHGDTAKVFFDHIAEYFG